MTRRMFLVLRVSLGIGCGALLLTTAPAAASVLYDDYFVEGTLRIDVIHSGTSDSEEVSMRRVIREPHWSGSKTNLEFPWDMGKYRIDVRDKDSGQLIYRHGFGTLFGEWQTTEEAKTTRRAFEETLESPYPKQPVEIQMFSRNKQGTMEQIFSIDVDPSFHLIQRAAAMPNAEVIELEINGDSASKVDILVLGDGYAVNERAKFIGDCEKFVDAFFDVEPFRSLRQRFNIRSVFLPSATSGVDEPRKNIFVDTPFGMTFSMFDLPRYCMTEAHWALHDAGGLAPHDTILLLGNSSRYGGGAIYNHYTTFISDNEYDDYVAVHEFGHGFAGLGDEYYTSAVAYNEFYPRGVEPWEANITALLDPEKLKWNEFVEKETPIPTPEDDERYAEKVGAFEGAGYAAKDLYRPQKDCKMFSKGNRDFCKVCEKTLVDLIYYYSAE